MLIYGVFGIFAHMKIILQPMIEQVWGGGWMCWEDVPLFCISFSELLYFCVSFYQFTDAFLGRFYQYLHFFAVDFVYLKESQTVFWAQNFCDVQLIPNFLGYPGWL